MADFRRPSIFYVPWFFSDSIDYPLSGWSLILSRWPYLALLVSCRRWQRDWHLRKFVFRCYSSSARPILAGFHRAGGGMVDVGCLLAGNGLAESDVTHAMAAQRPGFGCGFARCELAGCRW